MSNSTEKPEGQLARSIKGIKENLASMKRADNAWADRYVRDVGWLLNELDRVRDEAAQQAARETAEAGLYNEDGSYTLNAKVIAGRAAEEAATAALEQAVQVAEDYFTLKGNVWVEKYGNVKLEDAIRAIAAIGNDKGQGLESIHGKSRTSTPETPGRKTTSTS